MCDNAEEIAAGWARFLKEYEPRPLNSLEQRQLESAELEEKIAKQTSFNLGQPIHA
jgi:hypothetical protein